MTLDPNQAGDNPYAQFADPAYTAGATAAAPLAEPAKADAPANPYAKYAPRDLAPITDSGTTMGFNDEKPLEASDQLSKEDEAALIALAQHPETTADDLRRFAAERGHAIANADEVIAARDEGRGIYGQINYPLPKPKDPGTAGGAMARGMADSITLGTADELRGVTDASVAALKGESFSHAYHRSVDESRGQQRADEELHAPSRIAGELLGGIVLPVGLEKAGLTASIEAVGLKAGREALHEGASMSEARTIAQRAITRRLATEGGVYGAAYGAGSADGDAGQRLLGAVGGGTTGAALGAGLGGAGQLMAPRLREAQIEARAIPPTAGSQYYDAAQRLEIEPFAADVGGSTAKRFVAGTVQTPFGAGPLDEAASATLDTAQAARDRTAAAIGDVLRPEAMGEAIRTGAQKTIKATGAEARTFYDAGQTQSAGLRFSAPKALAALDEHIAELGEDPAGSTALGTLEAIRDRLSQGNLTVRGLRSMRTSLRDQFVKDGLRGSDTERRALDVVNAAADDISAGLRAAGKDEAAANFTKGDQLWRQRAQLIDQVFKPLIGTREQPKSGEQIVKTLMADLQGNNARAVKLLRSLPDDEQATTRASLIGGLGRSSKGRQNSEGDGFSLSAFLTHWNEIGESAKAAYFGPEARAALNDLAKVAEGSKLAQKYAGHSNTGAVGLANLTSGGLGAAVLALITFHPIIAATAALPAAYQAITSRVLANPSFVRWLARAPRSKLSGAAYLDRLSRIATAEPAIANDVLAIQRRLGEALRQLPVSAAASGPNANQDKADGR